MALRDLARDLEADDAHRRHEGLLIADDLGPRRAFEAFADQRIGRNRDAGRAEPLEQAQHKQGGGIVEQKAGRSGGAVKRQGREQKIAIADPLGDATGDRAADQDADPRHGFQQLRDQLTMRAAAEEDADGRQHRQQRDDEQHVEGDAGQNDEQADRAA